jgi:AraC-like DNA-binding protein
MNTRAKPSRQTRYDWGGYGRSGIAAGGGTGGPCHATGHPPRSTYHEFQPPAHLQDQVVCYWQSGASEIAGETRIIPDGCVDIIWKGEQVPFVAGPATTAIVHATDAATEIIGVRFRPGVAQRVLGVSAAELVDRDVPLPELWPRDRWQQWHDVAARETLSATMQAIDEALTARLAVSGERDEIIALSASWIAYHPRGRIDELQRLNGLGERQLRRRFLDAVGYGPKQLQRILRLQFLLWLANRERTALPNLARLAHAAGYIDQPHMTREVRALTGVSPRQLLSGRASALSPLFQR